MKKITLLLLLVSFTMKAQLTIKGKVVDEQNQPLPFVNVFIKGTSEGATTDDNGRFAFLMRKNRGTLEVSFVGFQTQTVQITPKTKYLNIVLKEGSNVLEEIIVVTKPKKRLKKKENPAYRILKEIWKRKRKNGLDLVTYYQYKKHTAIEVGLNNLDTVFLKNLFKEQYEETINEIKYDSDGINYYIPMYLSEQICNVYGDNQQHKIREDIEAEKSEGLSAQGFVFDRMRNNFQNVDVFKNNITIMKKPFESPLSTNGFDTYDYVLYDSIVKNNQKLYNIYFFPIRDEDFAFQGNVWVTDKKFSVKKIHMKVVKSANLNFVRGLTFEKEFEVKKDSIYIPTKNKYEADFTLIDKNDNNKGLTIKKTVSFSNYILDKGLPKGFYHEKTKKITPNQYAKNTSYWKKVEKHKNIATYKLIESVKGKRKIKALTGLINTLASGYINLPGSFQFGPFWTTVNFNDVEGVRTKLAFRTFKTKDDRFRLSGHIAYGFKDKRTKYGAEAKYLLSYKPRISSSIAYQNDVEQLGNVLLNTSQLLGKSVSTLVARGDNYFLSDVKKVASNFDYQIQKNLHLGFTFTLARIRSAATPDAFSMNYLDESGKIQSSITDLSSDIYLSFTPGRNVYGLGVQQPFGKNLYPALVINYHRGYKGPFNSAFDYDKIQLKYTQPVVLGKIGVLEATIEGGKTFGTVPLALLSPIPANQSYSMIANTFSLINYYDFVTDTYATGHFEHHFNGFILNRIPLLRKLKLRSLATFRIAYGTISKENSAINKSTIVYNTPNEKPYYEYGFGIENIGFGNFRFLRFDTVWRSNYTPLTTSITKPTPKFGVRVGLKLDL